MAEPISALPNEDAADPELAPAGYRSSIFSKLYIVLFVVGGIVA